MNHHESVYEMDRRIRELEDAMSANDEYLQRLEALNAELLSVLKKASHSRWDQEWIGQASEVIAKAQALK